MKKLTINNSQELEAEKIVKVLNNIKGYVGSVQVFEFPNISDENDFKLADGERWDIPLEDEKMLYDLNMDFRLSKIEMGL